MNKRYKRPASLASIDNDDALLDFPTVIAMTGLCETTIRKMTRGGDFPPPRRIGTHLVRWRAGDIKAWYATRPLAMV